MHFEKKIIAVYFFLLIPLIANSQEEKNYRVSAITEISDFYNGNITSYGFSIEYFVHRNISLNYQYSFGYNQFHNKYFHYPGGMAALIELFRTDSYFYFNSSGNDGWAAIFILAIVIPEGVSFHTYPRNWLELAPYINPLSTDYNVLDNYRSTITLNIGMKAYLKPFYNFNITPHFGLKHIYRTGKVGTVFGISIGYLF